VNQKFVEELSSATAGPSTAVAAATFAQDDNVFCLANFRLRTLEDAVHGRWRLRVLQPWKSFRSFSMTKTIRSVVVLAAAISLAGAVGFAQSSGEATYKAKCAICHGPAGVPSVGMAKMMGIKPASDPAIKKLTAAEMFTVVKDGKGKMKPIAGVTDAQIKDAVAFYRSLK
jgi:cytochrome c5